MRLATLALLTLPLLPAQPLYPWLESIAQRQLAARRDAVAALKTPDQIRARARDVRAKLTRWIGGLPAARTPLNPRVTGTLHRDGYRVEKILFESQPNFFVTASLYIPTTGKGPFPAVLQPTGHSVTAKARELYQSLSIGLVKYGFVVLTYDPLGQGERRIFFDPDLGDSKVGGTTIEHSMVGIQSLLGGESLARHMIWDGIRALDLLAARPEVDPARLGVSGCSGGGTLTAYIAALDDRVKVAAPSCYITAWEEQLPGTGPQDAEQQFPDQFLEGFNHGDFLIATAPKPYLIASTTEDFFPLSGARRTYEEAKEIYNRFGAEDKIAWFTAPGGHGMRADTRAAVYAWMRKWLANTPGPAPEPQFTVELEEDLNVTPTGQLSTSLGGETASTLSRKRLAALTPQTSDLPQSIRALTRFQPPASPLPVRQSGNTFQFDPEPGRTVTATLHQPAQSRGLFLAAGPNAAADLVAAGYSALELNLALTAETPDRREKALWLALMVGRTATGLRMADIAAALDLLAQRGLLPPAGLPAFARGNAGVAFLHAAALDPRLNQLILEDLPPTYRQIAALPVHRNIFDLVVPDVLKHYDLPALAAHIAPRPVTLGRTVPAPPPELFTAPNVRIVRRRELTSVADAYLPR